MQIDHALVPQPPATLVRDQTAARPTTGHATDSVSANAGSAGVTTDAVRVSEPARTLSAGASGSLVRERSTSLVIETRDGDRIRLDIRALARIDAAAVVATDGEQRLVGAGVARRSELSLQFSVEGTLDRRELKSLARVLHYVEEAAEEFYAGETDEALEKLAEMEVDPNVLASVSVDLQRSAAVRYAEVQRLSGGAVASPSSANPVPPLDGAAPASPARSKPVPPPSAAAPEAPPATSGASPVVPEVPDAVRRTSTPASPAVRLAAAVRSGLELATEGGLFRSPETGVKALFRGVLELVAQVRGGDVDKDGKGLPALLDRLLEAMTVPDEAEDSDVSMKAAAHESEADEAALDDDAHSGHDADGSERPDAEAAPARRMDPDTVPVNASAA